MKKETSKLLSRYCIEVGKKRNNLPYDELLINSLESKLKSENLLTEAKGMIKLEDEFDNNFKESEKACNSLFEIIKNITIWNFSENKDRVKELKDIVRSKDKNYTNRISLYEKLIKLPQFKDLEETEKIRIAMKLGALDFLE